jgi:hypothetical protein
MTVLETVGDGGANPRVRRFNRGGAALGSVEVAEPGAAAIQSGPDGPAVLGYPSGQWLPVVRNGTAVAAASQARLGRVGRVLAGGDELVAQQEGNEVRVAVVGPRGTRRGWRIRSATPLGEIQLARLVGSRVVLVVRVYDDTRDEFEALVLDDGGVRDRFSVSSRAWAETAPLARVRLAGTGLYVLGSTAAGVYVDRYELPVG